MAFARRTPAEDAFDQAHCTDDAMGLAQGPHSSLCSSSVPSGLCFAPPFPAKPVSASAGVSFRFGVWVGLFLFRDCVVLSCPQSEPGQDRPACQHEWGRGELADGTCVVCCAHVRLWCSAAAQFVPAGFSLSSNRVKQRCSVRSWPIAQPAATATPLRLWSRSSSRSGQLISSKTCERQALSRQHSCQQPPGRSYEHCWGTLFSTDFCSRRARERAVARSRVDMTCR